MSYTLKRTDLNQSIIVACLRTVGASVVSIASVGNGCPDIVVGYRGKNYLMEIKDGSKSPSQRKLTPAEVKFRKKWVGQYSVVENEEQALNVIGFSRN